MAMVTVSTKRPGRVYRRKFDHDLARALRAKGATYPEIARELDVSVGAVRRVCDDRERARMDAQTRKWVKANRVPCVGGCGALIWPTSAPHRSGYCYRCWNALRTEDDELDGELRCSACRLWKPDAEFGKEKRPTRRGRRSQCNTCGAANRKDYRRRHAAAEHEKDRARKPAHRNQKELPVNKYLVMQQNGDGHWKQITDVEASTPVQAVEKTVSDAGTYVAVAESHVVDIEPVTILKAKSRKLSGVRRPAEQSVT